MVGVVGHKDTPESFWERMRLIHGPDVGPRQGVNMPPPTVQLPPVTERERDVIVEALDNLYDDACENLDEGRIEEIATLVVRIRRA